MAGEVRTVTGPISPHTLGITSMHDHLILDLNIGRIGIKEGHDLLLTETDVLDDVFEFERAGGRCIVEVSEIGMGRDVTKLRELAQKTKVHIVASTGFYTEPSYPRYVLDSTADELTDFMSREITDGINNTEVRAGIIGEIGSWHAKMTENEEKVLRAACRTSRRTGAAMSIHLTWGEDALTKAEICREEGVDPSRLIFGHMDLLPDIEYHTAIAEKGSYVEYDTIGRNGSYLPEHQRSNPSDSQTALMIREMISRGFDRLLLGTDICRREYLRKYGGWGYAHLPESFVPRLRAQGVSESAIRKMLIENPRKILGF